MLICTFSHLQCLRLSWGAPQSYFPSTMWFYFMSSELLLNVTGLHNSYKPRLLSYLSPPAPSEVPPYAHTRPGARGDPGGQLGVLHALISKVLSRLLIGEWKDSSPFSAQVVMQSFASVSRVMVRHVEYSMQRSPAFQIHVVNLRWHEKEDPQFNVSLYWGS